MIYKQYGKTDMNVSAVGFGGMQFDTSIANEENAKLLHYAHDKGINYFDTAPGYCSDQSEDIFGIAIDQMAANRDKFYVSTKAMPVKFDTADKAIGAVESSLKRLKTDYIDFFHVWCIRRIDQYELAMQKGGQYEGLMKCVEQGKVKNIVISTHLPGNEAGQIIAKNEFKGILLGVNILNFMYRWAGVQAAYDAGMGVVAMNPLSGGMIPQHEADLQYLTKPGQTATEAALDFCISCPQITITLNGFTTTDHIDTACKVADNSTPLTQADIDALKEKLAENMNNAVCTGCGYCLGSCPKDIPIPGYMQYYNNKVMFNKTEEQMKDLLNHHYTWGNMVDRKAEAKDCIKCRKCEDVCTQHLDIINRLEDIDKIQQAAGL